MSETSVNRTRKTRRIRHRGRTSQIPIYLGKQLRFFINESYWKVIPMAAVIAGLVSILFKWFADVILESVSGYYNKQVDVRANWDTEITWNAKSIPILQQKPEGLRKNTSSKSRQTAHQRNLERRKEKRK